MKKMTYALPYLIVAFLFIAGSTGRAQNISIDFENRSIGDTVKGIGWAATDILAQVANDPLASGNKVLKNTINNYNAAPVLAFTLPAGKTLANYKTFTMKSYWAQGDVGYKDIIVEAYQTMPTAQFANNAAAKIGSWNRASMGSTAWENITVDITNTSSFSGTIYVAVGINCAGTGNVGGTGVQTIWYADNLTLAGAPADPSLVAQWGSTPRGTNGWTILNTASTPAGNAAMGGTAAPTGWMSIKGGFDPITPTTSQALVISGTFEFVGGGGGSAYTWLRYALFYGEGALTGQNTPTAAWSETANGFGYIFTPVTGGGTISNTYNSWPSGTQGTEWLLNNSKSWTSTNTNNGGPFSTILQVPHNQVATAGVYDWAISVQPLSTGGSEVRWYFIQQHTAGSTNYYWWGGTFVDPTPVTAKFNSIGFGVNNDVDATCKQVNLANVKATLGAPITVPGAPWVAYYIDKWGFIGGRMYGWNFIPDPALIIGNAGIGGTAPNGKWAAIRGGFDPVTPTASKALLVTGKVEFVGGGFEAVNSFRFGVFYSDKAGKVILDSSKATLPDSTRWDGLETYTTGYLFIPPSGTNGLANWTGVSQTGSSGAVVNGAWLHNDYPAAGPAILTSNYVLGQDVQTPANAVGGAGVYNFTISVATGARGSNDVRYKLAKSDNSYSITGKLADANIPPATLKFNSVNFAIGQNFSTTAMKLTDVKVDYVDVASVPITSNAAGVTSVGESGGIMPAEFALGQNYPNPFNPSTTITYDIAKAAHVTIQVYDVLGRMVGQLVDAVQSPSRYVLQWNPAGLSSGTYLYRIDARNVDGSGNFTAVKKLILMK